MKQLALILLSFMLMTFAHGQSTTIPAGGTASGPGGSATYTTGQPAEQYVTGSGSVSVAEGVQQPYEFYTIGLDEYENIMLEAIVFPNPTLNFVQLKITNFEIPDKDFEARLFDKNGKLLQIIPIKELLTKIEMQSLPTASYQLTIFNQKKVMKTFTIIKNKFY